MRSIARSVFSFLLRLHPTEFRNEFGAEILWIFDESIESARPGLTSTHICAYLLFDIAHSAFVQRLVREQASSKADGWMFFEIAPSGLLVRGVEQMLILFACLCTAFNILLSLYMI